MRINTVAIDILIDIHTHMHACVIHSYIYVHVLCKWEQSLPPSFVQILAIDMKTKDVQGSVRVHLRGNILFSRGWKMPYITNYVSTWLSKDWMEGRQSKWGEAYGKVKQNMQYLWDSKEHSFRGAKGSLWLEKSVKGRRGKSWRGRVSRGEG